MIHAPRVRYAVTTLAPVALTSGSPRLGMRATEHASNRLRGEAASSGQNLHELFPFNLLSQILNHPILLSTELAGEGSSAGELASHTSRHWESVQTRRRPPKRACQSTQSMVGPTGRLVTRFAT